MAHKHTITIIDSNGSTTDIDEDPHSYAYTPDDSKRKKHAASGGDRDTVVTKKRGKRGGPNADRRDPDCNGNA
jgi:hypothetical protein